MQPFHFFKKESVLTCRAPESCADITQMFWKSIAFTHTTVGAVMFDPFLLIPPLVLQYQQP